MKRIIAVFLSVIIAVSCSGIILSASDTSAKAAEVPDLYINKNYIGLQVGQTRTLLAYSTVSTDFYKLTWSSENTDIARVSDEGAVTAVSTGKTKVFAKIQELGLSVYCTVNVTEGKIKGNFDFSETNIITNMSSFASDGTGYSIDEGGNSAMSNAYLTRWDGAVLEANDPFPVSGKTSDIVYNELQSDYHMQNILFLPDRTDYLDNYKIKQAVIEYGAVFASFALNNFCFGDNDINYYKPESIKSSGGHAVAIVGWDDSYSRSNFKYTPDGDGAFICKNSWGSASGDGGYIYISYYDSTIGKRDVLTVYTGLEGNTNYNKIYQYDPYGAVTSYSISGNKNYFYAANVFPEEGKTLQKNEELCAVSFYTNAPYTDYEIYVVSDYSSSEELFDNKKLVKTGTFNDMGYHTVEFDPVMIKKGSRFAVTVKLSSEEKCYFSAEVPVDDFSPNARANSDESFISYDGVTWTDINEEYENLNFCIKAFTNVYDGDLSQGSMLKAIDNGNREYQSDKIYTADDLYEDKNIAISPEFVEYYRQKNSSLSKASGMMDEFSSVPNPIVLSSASYDEEYTCFLPSYFHLKNEDGVTGIKNQRDVNGCWAFATCASIESCLLRNTSCLTEINDDMSATDEINAIIAAVSTDLTSLNLSCIENEIFVGDKFSLLVDANPINAEFGRLLWSSSDNNIATVDLRGNVTAHYPGMVVIFAEDSESGVTAQFTVTVKARPFSVKWNVDGNITEQIINEFDIINPDVVPEKTGHTFRGWEPAVPEVMPSENIEFTATWSVNSYNVRFDAKGGKWYDGYSTKTVSTLFDTEIILPEDPQRAGYDFNGWEGSVPLTMPANDLSFSAQWVPRNDTKYGVTVYTMNPDGSYSVTSEKNYTGTTESEVSTSVGEIKEGFFLNTEKSILSGKIIGDGSFVLKVYIDREEYTLITIADGVEDKKQYRYGEKILQPQIPHKEGYYFCGWEPTLPETMPLNNITVNAIFEKLYSISIKNNPGTATLNYGDTLVLTAISDELPENSYIKWTYVGSGVEGTYNKESSECRITSVESGTVMIYATVVDENGIPVLNPDGSEITASQKIVSNAGLFRKIISFFKNLFGINRTTLQVFKNGF